ncbi:MAG: M1 family metallopeptidase [Nitrososphaerales archaeon]|nr:M1 family metallopeptidase [Nitrososphaerales archaeon]
MEITSYDLKFDVDFAKARMNGVAILHLKGYQDPLLLDAVGLDIQAVRVNGEPWRSRYDKKKGKLKIPRIPRKESEVEIHYSKQVAEETIFGLYKSKYDGDYMLVTDLEPAEARTVFPCKDEPACKAVFNLSVTTETGLKVISNSTAVSVQPTADGRVKHVFDPSPRMSTYLFFMGIGRFEESKVKAGKTEVISASRPGTSQNARFILDVSAHVLQDYERYFGIPYPLKKLHLVGLPEYHTGAMENWGAIAARESYVILEKGASLYDFRHAAYIQTHEIAHMWFGDLVTMKWWDDLWLNESFAAFLEHRMLDRFHPEWDIWKDFLRFETFPSMNTDALSSTHPIQVKVETVSEVQQVFDAISYGKGAAILRMVESYVGEEAFRKGVSAYLRRFSYSNARGEDLWRSIARASGRPVTRVMAQWITKRGFPVVKVRAGRGKIKLSQSRFQLSGRASRETWPIPLTIQAGGKSTSFLFDSPTATINAPSADGLLVNPRRTGFYSVLYDDETYDALARRFYNMHAHDKAGLISDLFLFLQSGTVKPETYFRFLSLCGRSSDALLIELATDHLSILRSIADEAPMVRRAYDEFFVPAADRVGVSPREGEDPNMGTARESLMAYVVRVDEGYARRLAARFSDFATVEPDLKAAVATAYSMVNGSSAYEPLVRLLKNGSEQDRAKAYIALTASRDHSVVERTLELSISGDVSRSDSGYTIAGAATNPLARRVTWEWIARRYDAIKAIYGGAQQFYLYLDRALPRCGIGSEEEVRAFISGPRFDEGKITFRRTFERLEVYSRLRRTLLSS